MASWCRPRNPSRRAAVTFRANDASAKTSRGLERVDEPEKKTLAANDDATTALVAASSTASFSALLATKLPTHAFSDAGKLSAYGKNEPRREGNEPERRFSRVSSEGALTLAKYSRGVDQRNRRGGEDAAKTVFFFVFFWLSERPKATRLSGTFCVRVTSAFVTESRRTWFLGRHAIEHVAPRAEREVRVDEPEIVPDQNQRVAVRYSTRRSLCGFQQRRRGASQ